jgi:MFS family permease
MATAGITSSYERTSIPASHVVAVVIGNGLEFYDFLCFATFAVYIGRTFFPFHSGYLSLLSSLVTFGVGFVTRPIGGIVLGSLGDRIGRKPAMLISFMLIGIGMLGLALTPSFAQIGIAAPILIVCFRLVQGFALGGEVGPTTAYMIEAAPRMRRGYYGSMQYTSQFTAVLVGACIGVILASSLNASELQDWGWRVAFLLGVIVVPFGIYIRRTLPESLHAADDAALSPDATAGSMTVRERLGPHAKVLVLSFILLANGTISTYVINYMTTFALTTLRLPATIAFGVTVVTAGVTVSLTPLSGILSDRFGRKPVMIFPSLAFLVLLLPLFWLMLRSPNALLIYGIMALIAALSALGLTPIIVAFTELMPRSVRSGAVSTVYAFAIAIFGGSAQAIVTWLLKVTGDAMAPAYYLMAASVLGLIAMFLMPESAPAKLDAAMPGLRTAAVNA